MSAHLSARHGGKGWRHNAMICAMVTDRNLWSSEGSKSLSLGLLRSLQALNLLVLLAIKTVNLRGCGSEAYLYWRGWHADFAVSA